jgi:hypothetical protein
MQGVMYYGSGGICGYKTFLDRCLGSLESTVKRLIFP